MEPTESFRSIEPGAEEETSSTSSVAPFSTTLRRHYFGGPAGDLTTDFNLRVAPIADEQGIHTPKSTTSGRSSLVSVARAIGAITNYFYRYLRRQPLPDDAMVEMSDNERRDRNQSEEAFHQMFETLDQDQDGGVDVAELKRVMDGIGLTATQGELVRLFKRADRDGDGVITFDDYRLDWIERWKTVKNREPLVIGLFKLLDLSSDGVIEHKEVKMVMMSIGEKVTNQEIDEMFKQFDKNNSGVIDPDEFSKAMIAHINKIMPKEGDVERLKSEAQKRATRIQTLETRDDEEAGQKLLEAKDDESTPAILISSV